MNIDWKTFDGQYVKLEEDTPKTLVLENWRQSMSTFNEQDPKPCLQFDVVEEDGKDLQGARFWTVTSVRLIPKLKPIVLKAEEKGLKRIKITVTKVGDKKETQYSVQDKTNELAAAEGPAIPKNNTEALKKKRENLEALKENMTPEGYQKMMSRIDEEIKLAEQH